MPKTPPRPEAQGGCDRQRRLGGIISLLPFAYRLHYRSLDGSALDNADIETLIEDWERNNDPRFSLVWAQARHGLGLVTHQLGRQDFELSYHCGTYWNLPRVRTFTKNAVPGFFTCRRLPCHCCRNRDATGLIDIRRPNRSSIGKVSIRSPVGQDGRCIVDMWF